MFCYFENGRNTWAVRNDGGVLVARFLTQADAQHFIAQSEPPSATPQPPRL
jgi:hypothetical protein